MAETGVLRHDARVELLDGEIIDMSPTGPPHGGVTKRLNHHGSTVMLRAGEKACPLAFPDAAVDVTELLG